MNASRKAARIVAVLFIVGTVAGVLSAVISGSMLNADGYLTELAENESQVVTGALLVLIMGFTLAMVPAVLFPIFKRYNESLALGAVIFRGVLEAVTYVGIVVVSLSLLKLSQEYVRAGAPDVSYFQTLGALLRQANLWVVHVLDIVFSLGALLIYYLFYQTKLIPRWLSIWGLIGAILYIAVPFISMLGSELGFLAFPLALQEMVLAVWLIVKGFNPSALAPGLARTDTN